MSTRRAVTAVAASLRGFLSVLRRRPERRTGRRRGESWEAVLSRISHDVQAWVEAGRPVWRYFLSHPQAGVVGAYAVTRLPRLTAELGETGDAEVIREAVMAGPALGPFRHKSVLVLPDDASCFLAGPSAATLRRYARKALGLGVTWRTVDTPDDRLRMLALAENWEREHPDARYRNEDTDNAALLERGLWLAAYLPPDDHVLLALIMLDGSWACLRYYRTIGTGEAQTKARYLMMQVLVEVLVGRGVRYLVDERVPAALPNGLRHFQRMVGFRVHRVRWVRR